jgi:hypothetical protein
MLEYPFFNDDEPGGVVKSDYQSGDGSLALLFSGCEKCRDLLSASLALQTLSLLHSLKSP